MQKTFLLLTIIITIAGTGCSNAGEQEKQEIKSEKHDTAHKEKTEADTLGMKMGGNELDSKKK